MCSVFYGEHDSMHDFFHICKMISSSRKWIGKAIVDLSEISFRYSGFHLKNT